MAYTTRLAWETLRTLDTATLTGAYAAVGARLVHPAYIVKMINNSDVLVTVSIDGSTDIDVLPANSFFLYDELKSVNEESLPANTQFYVKGSAGTGLIYLVVQYLKTT